MVADPNQLADVTVEVKCAIENSEEMNNRSVISTVQPYISLFSSVTLSGHQQVLARVSDCRCSWELPISCTLVSVPIMRKAFHLLVSKKFTPSSTSSLWTFSVSHHHCGQVRHYAPHLVSTTFINCHSILYSNFHLVQIC